MTVVFTIIKKIVDNKQIIGITTDEVVMEDVRGFYYDEGKQKITVQFNVEPEEVIELYKSEGNHIEQCFFLDAKCIQVPLKVKL